MSLLDPEFFNPETGQDPRAEVGSGRVPLDVLHHDQPERHTIGKTMLQPNIIKEVGATAAVATPGKSLAPAREDHIHGPGTHAHSGYADVGHTHPPPAEQVTVGGKRIATGPASGTFGGLTGSPAASTTNLMVQAGTVVASTDGSGLINVVYPQIFPNGVISIVAMMGFFQPWLITASDSAFNTTFHQFKVYSNTSGGIVANTVIRFNWIAIGW